MPVKQTLIYAVRINTKYGYKLFGKQSSVTRKILCGAGERIGQGSRRGGGPSSRPFIHKKNVYNRSPYYKMADYCKIVQY